MQHRSQRDISGLFTIPGHPEPDVAVRVARRVVQIQRQHSGIAAIVPIATAKEATQAHNNRITISSILLIVKAAKSQFDNIVSLETLFMAHKKAIKGKRNNRTATAFDANLAGELLLLQTELVDGTYRPHAYRKKVIREPKVRLIEAPAYRDRIVHHALHETLGKLYERHFIPDSFACRPGRGIHQAADRVQHFLRSGGPGIYVCKLDISKYYASINHGRLMELLRTKIDDERTINLLQVIIDSTDSGDEHAELFASDSHYFTKGRRGIPIGNLTSQLFANVYLHHADMYAKHQLKIRHYVRYMDDILFFHHDKAQLQTWRAAMTTFLYDDLYLTINPHKVRVYPSRVGVDFVGYVVHPHYKRLRGSSVRRFKKKYRKQLVAVMRGHMDPEAMRESFASWEAHAKHAKSARLRAHLREWQNDYLFVLALHRAIRRQRRALNAPIQLSLFDTDEV